MKRALEAQRVFWVTVVVLLSCSSYAAESVDPGCYQYKWGKIQFERETDLAQAAVNNDTTSVKGENGESAFNILSCAGDFSDFGGDILSGIPSLSDILSGGREAAKRVACNKTGEWSDELRDQLDEEYNAPFDLLDVSVGFGNEGTFDFEEGRSSIPDRVSRELGRELDDQLDNARDRLETDAHGLR